MKVSSIDNTDRGDIDRSITWQFDNARNIVGLIEFVQQFYDGCVRDFFNALPGRLDLTNPETCDDFGLCVWGNLLGVGRLDLTYVHEGDSGPTTTPMSSGLYRVVLLARARLVWDDATLPAYARFAQTIFGSSVRAVDGKDMSLRLEASEDNDLDNERRALLDLQDDIMPYPAGVRSSGKCDDVMFGFNGQQNNRAEGDPQIGGFDYSCLNWRTTSRCGTWVD